METGLYPHCASHRTNWHLIRGHEPHLFRYLFDAGYDIRWYGKNDMLAQDSLICIEEYIEPEAPVRKNRHELGDKAYYSFDAEPLDGGREDHPDYVKVKAGIVLLKKQKKR